jgi:hypothetical protein
LADSDFRSVEGVEAWSYIDVLVENNLSGKLNKILTVMQLFSSQSVKFEYNLLVFF